MEVKRNRTAKDKERYESRGTVLL